MFHKYFIVNKFSTLSKCFADGSSSLLHKIVQIQIFVRIKDELRDVSKIKLCNKSTNRVLNTFYKVEHGLKNFYLGSRSQKGQSSGVPMDINDKKVRKKVKKK